MIYLSETKPKMALNDNNRSDLVVAFTDSGPKLRPGSAVATAVFEQWQHCFLRCFGCSQVPSYFGNTCSSVGSFAVLRHWSTHCSKHQGVLNGFATFPEETGCVGLRRARSVQLMLMLC